MEAVAGWILIVIGAYALAGLLYGVWFVARAVDRFDHGAAGAGWGFRLLILPGVAALWPWMESRRRRAVEREA